MKSNEWYWENSEGQRIFSQSWEAANPQGQIIIVHGLGEHSGRYLDVADYLTKLEWNVSAMDLPGHGQTEGPKGYVRSWASLLSTLERFLSHRHVADLPLYLYGHSMGGSLALQVAMRRAHQVRGVIASSPPIRIVQEVPKWKVSLAKMLGPAIPALRFNSGIEAELLSRDQTAVDNYLEDPLVNSRVSPALGLGLLEIGPWLLKQASELTVPTLILHGDADRIADISGSREFCESVGQSCRLIEFPGYYHELHHDPGGRQVLATAAAWLDSGATAASSE